MRIRGRRGSVLVLSLFLAFGGACSTDKPAVVIQAPPHGSQFREGEEIHVQSLASDPGGVTRVELVVNGATIRSDSPPNPQGQPSFLVVQKWQAVQGNHTLMVRAYNGRGLVSDPVGVSVSVSPAVTPTVPAAATPILVAPTNAPPPTVATASATVTQAPPTATTTCTPNAAFESDVTVPPGTPWVPGQAFNKIWRIRNDGTCPWDASYQFVSVGGEPMTTQLALPVPSVMPGATGDILIAMTAPQTVGGHSGNWQMHGPAELFGPVFVVSINVISPQPALPANCPGVPVIASFAANPAAISPGQSSTLSWGKVDNADSATIDQGIGGIATPGEQSVSPASTTTYTLTASGCGGTVTKQVTITASGSSAILPLQPVTIPGADLQMTDLYAQGNVLYGVIKNNGPDKVSNLVMGFSCSASKTAYGAQLGVMSSSRNKTMTIVSLDKGQTTPFNTSLTLDLNQFWYKITCTIQVPFDNLNSDKSNDSFTKTLTK